MKKINRFKNIKRWLPISENVMQQTDSTGSSYVRISDYNEMLRELEMERYRLKKAGDLINLLIKSECK